MKYYCTLLCAVFLLVGCGAGSKDDGNPNAGSGVINFKTSRIGSAGGFVDVNNDGNQDLIIGAPEAQGGEHKTGVATVMLAEGDTIRQHIYTTLSGEKKGDFFGYTIANLGDVNGDDKEDFAIGAINAEGEAGISGAVYVYQGSEHGPVLISKLKGEEAFSKFGFSIAGGDLNNDGINDVVVSAPYTFSQEFQAGAVYIYFGGHHLSHEADVVIKGDKVNASVGFALATGDVNGDNIDDLIMDGHSKVFIYYGGADIKTRIAENMTPNVNIRSDAGAHGGSGFGWSLAYAGDVDGDGFGDIAVGNPRRSSPSVYDSAGSFYIFRGGDNLPAEFFEDDATHRLVKIVGSSNDDHLGSAIVNIGDVNDDQKPDFLVGANWANAGADGKATIAGVVYLFHSDKLNVADASHDQSVLLATHAYSLEQSSAEFGTTIAAKGETLFSGAPGAHKHDGGFAVVSIHDGGKVDGGSGLNGGTGGGHVHAH
ncbi:MAG: integrin alpha [Gammaproteobacteria bacterium]|nr:integrin alpha [Gammaproteobacteria bacterium]